MHPLDYSLPAPTGSAVAELKYLGDVGFGPPYFGLAIGDLTLSRRTFGSRLAWSSDGALLFAEEWLSTSNVNTRLICVDVANLRECTIASAVGGFVFPEAVDDQWIRYAEKYFSGKRAGLTQHELLIANLGGWSAL